MSNARARARQLERAALAPKRKPHGPVGPQLNACETDTTCTECGFMVCNCADGPEPPPFGERGFTYARPAPQPAPGAFVVPKGWHKHEMHDGTWLSLRADKPFMRPCVATQKDGKWGGWAPTMKYGAFAGPYAAMLCALGARVEACNHEFRVWGPDKMGAPNQHGERYHGILDSMSLLALVERLTAERAAITRARQQGEQIGRELAREQQGGALAPGWRRVNVDGFIHTSNALVMPNGKGWGYVHCDAEHCEVRLADGIAPTRDEAMALALGWRRNERGRHWESDDCGVAIDDEHTFASLPHAIAWARGES